MQGVGFRWATHRRAQDLALSGWVRNLPDGSVEVLAQGDDPAIDDLLRWLQHGPPGAVVTSVTTKPTVPDPDLGGFGITG